MLGREQAREQALVNAAAQAALFSGSPDANGLVVSHRPRGDTVPRQRARADAQARRQLRFEACRQLHAEGKRMREIVAELHMGPNTVRRFLRAEACPQRAAVTQRPSRLAPFEPYLRERWDAGEQNGRHLLAEIQARG